MSDAEPDSPEIDTTPVAAESDVAFPRLDLAQIETLRTAGRTVSLETGEIIFSPGELDYDLIVVLTGASRSSTRSTPSTSASWSATGPVSSPAS